MKRTRSKSPAKWLAVLAGAFSAIGGGCALAERAGWFPSHSRHARQRPNPGSIEELNDALQRLFSEPPADVPDLWIPSPADNDR